MKKRKKLPFHDKYYRWFIAMVIGVCVTSLIWVYFFSTEIAGETSGQISKLFIEELTRHTILHFQDMVEQKTIALDTMSHFLLQYDLKTEEEIYVFLQEMEKLYKMPYIALLDEQGNIYTKEGRISHNFYKIRPEGMPLEDSGLVTYDTSIFRDPVILIGLRMEPVVIQDKQLVGIFMGLQTKEISNHLDMEHRNSKTYVSVVFKNGSYIINNANENVYDGGSNIFSQISKRAKFYEDMNLEKLQKAFLEKESGFASYVLDQRRQNIYYAPIPDTEWLVVSAVSYSSVTASIASMSGKMLFGAAVVCMTIVIAISAVFESYTISMKKKEQQLLEANNRAEEAGKQLKKALYMAQVANRSKSIFLANMSHDIRTPLNAIIGFSVLLKDNLNHPDKVEKYSQNIENSGIHLLHLVNDVLDMSQIETGKMELNPKNTRLSKIIEEVCLIIRQRADQKDLEFEICENYQDDCVKADSLRMQQILLNLLSNAVKYTNNGGRIRFTITQMPCDTKGETTYRFEVADTGIGMEKEFLDVIYEMFSRERSGTVSKVQGTGLGMAITKSLVDLMNGTIKVESTPGKGTTFTVDLSLEQVNDPTHKNAEGEEKNVLFGKHFLAAEDDEINGEILKELFKMVGAEVDIAENGKQAVELFVNSSKDGYDAIFMDIYMPVLDGYEATKLIRQSNHPDANTIPIIAMTANAFPEDVQATLAAGMNAHIAKPIDIHLINKAIAELV